MTVEAALDSEIEICDPHHHLWEHPQSVYLPPELSLDIQSGGHNVTSTVFVECRSAYEPTGPEQLRPVGETGWVRTITAPRLDESGIASGIVGYADLTVGAAVTDVIAAHAEAGHGRFRGIRHASGWDADDRIRNSHTDPPAQLFAMPKFREGLTALGAGGFTFDAWLYHPQLPELVDLARACPDVTIVLDHLGGPLGIGPYAGRRDEVLAVWRSSMKEVAACENVVVKLGGIGMPIFGMDWHHRDVKPSSEEVAAAWGPEVRWCIETFGVDRAMFESNFPVDARSFSYSVCWNTFLRIAGDLSDAERCGLFHDTAARVYRLGSSA